MVRPLVSAWSLFFAVSVIGIPIAQLVSAQEDVPEPLSQATSIESQTVSQERRQDRSNSSDRKVFRDRVVPHWSSDGERFWYRNDLPDRNKEFIIVDAARGVRRLAFDHQKVARALGPEFDSTSLPLNEIAFGDGEDLYLIGNRFWLWSDSREILREVSELPDEVLKQRSKATPPTKRTWTGADTELTIENQTPGAIEIFWVSEPGKRVSYGKIAEGRSRNQHTFGGHRWIVTNSNGEEILSIVASDQPTTILVDGKQSKESKDLEGERPRRGRNAGRADIWRSPDGKWVVQKEKHNLVVENHETQESHPLTDDGFDGNAYETIAWSPDSKTLVAFRVQPGEAKEVHLIQSSPPEGGRAKLQSRPYALPGDRFAKHEINLFHLPSRTHIRPEVDPFEHERNPPRIRWHADSTKFSYSQSDRGHQRFRLIEIDISGGVRTLIDERSSTFIWTEHVDSLPKISWLESTEEILYVSEMSGWRHATLLDSKSGEVKNPVTAGNWVLRGIDDIDEVDRQLWFRASGCFEGQDPYFIHYGRVRFDGTGLVWLTRGNGTHSIQYSPDKRYLIDTYSRVDSPPVTELRRVSDGSLLCELESADIELLIRDGWKGPSVHSFAGRDGVTDIWGFLEFPSNRKPGVRYPVIEEIYAGPHGAHVPKTFSPTSRYKSLTELGFIVAKIDGMGTAHRSKAFHDRCWKDLKDAGLEDRISWMRQAAKIYPEMDLDRVGIYGTSAGGQNAAGALLFHPEFYKVAVAACGCHDNRMDKASWNEQWMGYPVGPHYSQSSNIDNAHRLEGKLLLIVGEMDTNVPPESTLRFADALIRADKDFDLLVVPNGGHGMGGTYGQRRMRDFFVRHLLGNEHQLGK